MDVKRRARRGRNDPNDHPKNRVGESRYPRRLCEGFSDRERDDCRKNQEMNSETVAQPPSTEIGVSNIPSWKTKKLGKPTREKVLLEP